MIIRNFIFSLFLYCFAALAAAEPCGKVNADTILAEILERKISAEQISNFRSLIQEEQFDGAKILFSLETAFNLKELFDGDVGVSEGYTLRQHTLMVMDRLKIMVPERNVNNMKFGEIRILPLLVAATILHDIGKPLAVKSGNKFRQHQYTIPILKSFLSQLQFSSREIAIAETIVDHDVLGGFIVRRKSVGVVESEIRNWSQNLNVNPKDLLDLLETFYLADATSYPQLQRYFERDGQGRTTDYRGFLTLLRRRIESDRPLSVDEGGDFLSPAEIQQFISVNGSISEADREPWKFIGKSDPLRHDPDHFSYYIHAVKDSRMIYPLLTDGQPQDFPAISLSLISQDRTNSWSPSGILVDVPAENIIAVEKEDMRISGTATERPQPKVILERFAAIRGKPGLATPQQILADTRRVNNAVYHNEAFVIGKSAKGTRISIKGLFYKVDSFGNPFIEANDILELKMLMREFGLPLIQIGPSKGVYLLKISRLSNENPDTVVVHTSEREYLRMLRLASENGVRLIGADIDQAPWLIFDGEKAIADTSYQPQMENWFTTSVPLPPENARKVYKVIFKY